MKCFLATQLLVVLSDGQLNILTENFTLFRQLNHNQILTKMIF